MKSYDVSIDFGTDDSDLSYVAFGKDDQAKKAINSLSLSGVASLTCDIVKFIYESYLGKSFPEPENKVNWSFFVDRLSQFVEDMVTIDLMDQVRYEKEFLE